MSDREPSRWQHNRKYPQPPTRPITLCVNDVNKQQYESVNNARDTMCAFTRKDLWAGDIYDYAAI